MYYVFVTHELGKAISGGNVLPYLRTTFRDFSSIASKLSKESRFNNQKHPKTQNSVIILVIFLIINISRNHNYTGNCMQSNIMKLERFLPL